ncbi:DHA2 family efflux MFS transporter permease subunit [Chitinophaga sp. Cy-1792]|uniref:DHA2 family efflux MFS transporter permease subunit n=1 Tax=Chitinophaga sp. Cy-1792 TaxID=2608339 RepID=UPI001422E437|nr:DHA2 family efflux MFS transporter permease subunit [Chitinophaga sp. Cy-1792]NIG55137.1 DHA2 family efflux MFS transporter permease subunit [Chitinophaga sp. Cy-1792]
MNALKRQILIFTVISAAIMELIDISIVNVALSHMSGNLGSTLADTSWVVTSYAIANVIVIPMSSFLSTSLGRRTYYIGSVILFTICSFMCGNASNIWVLVFFRFLQGLGGGALLSVSQTIMFELFPKEKQSMASALFGLGVFIGPTIGPTLGGFITENYSWPWIFYINIPVGIVVTLSCLLLLQESPIRQTVKKVDWTGILLLIIGVSTLQTVLERGQEEDWFDTAYITVFTFIAIAAIILFIIWELKVDEPVVNLRVFKSRTLTVAAILTFITGIGMFTSVYLTPVFAQRLLGFTPLETGLLLLPGSFFALLSLIISGRLLQNGLSPVVMIVIGFTLFIYFSYTMASLSPDASAQLISNNLIYRAVGIALLTVPLTMLAVSTLEMKDIAQGAALNNMMRQLGGSFGIAIVNTYTARRTAYHRNHLVADLNPDNPAVLERLNSYTHYFLSHGSTPGNAHQRALGLMEYGVVKQSTLLSYLDSFALVGILFLACLPLLFMVQKRSTSALALKNISDH